MTYAKSEEQEAPACLHKLKYEKQKENGGVDISAEIRRFVEEGNVHFLSFGGGRKTIKPSETDEGEEEREIVLPPPSITVGTLNWEWRVLSCGVFSRERTRLSIEDLIAAAPADTTFPLWVRQKYYHNMAGVSSHEAIAEFTPDELREWAQFFELQPGDWQDARSAFKL